MWSGMPQNIILNSWYLAAGVLVLIGDRYFNPLYNEEDLKIFLSKEKKVGNYSFELFSYLSKNVYLLPALIQVVLVIIYPYQGLIN